jgi:hypothetical protein
MTTRTVLMDFGLLIFGESPCQQIRGGHAMSSEATDAEQIADSDERTTAMPAILKDAERAAPTANEDLNP